MINTVKLKGMKLNDIKSNDLFELLNNKIIDNNRNYISITNTEAMYIGLKNKNHFKFINNSFLSLCDGTGLLIAAKFNGLKIKKYHGPNFFEDVIKEGQKYGWTHYFLGGKEGVGNKLKSKFQNQYPNSKIVGVYSPPFRQLTNIEEKKMIKNINMIKPNFIWVSLGLPKQENWIAKYLPEIDVNFACGVGAAFDFHSDSVKRAPIFFQKIGMEWLYRTFFEKRLIVRQIRGFKFLLKAIINNKN